VARYAVKIRRRKVMARHVNYAALKPSLEGRFCFVRYKNRVPGNDFI
jgi:hypothetical protein